VLPQLIPAGELVIVPFAVPLFQTYSVTGTGLNVATTDNGPVTVSAQVELVPVHAPDQPVNT
jgi:hypothetical protein